MIKETLEHEDRNNGTFVILSGERYFSVINKIEEIRIQCECVGGSILEAIPKTSGTSDGTHTGIRLEQEQRKDHCKVIKEFSKTLQNRRRLSEELTKKFNGKMQSLKFSLDKNEEVIG